MLSARLAAALGVGPGAIEATGQGPLSVRVDDADRRYRDAIKAGAEGVSPPKNEAGEGDGPRARAAVLKDRATGVRFRIHSAAGG